MTAQITPMPERWTELIASRRQKQLCSEQVEALKQTCKAEHNKDHISECPECYDRALERIRLRYTDSEAREWFTERRAFVQELEGLFAEVKQRKKSLGLIEVMVESEKEAWYRWMLRRHPDFLAVADNGSHQNDLRGMLDDPDRSREELVKRMWEGVGGHDDCSSRVDSFAEKVMAAGENVEALKKLYVDEFFINSTTGEPLKHSEKYLSKYKDDENVSLEGVIGMIVQDSQLSRSSQPHRDSHQGRLDELRRAKTAFELNRPQTKGRSHVGQVSATSEELYDMPPCSVCENAVDYKDVLSCAVCQAATQLGGEKKLTVYCSEECYRKGHDDHAEKEHTCEAGDRCSYVYDEDVEMGDGVSNMVVCIECLDEQRITLYCSEHCAVENLGSHRQAKHGVKTAAEEVQSLVTPLNQAVESILEAKNPGLKLSLMN